MLFFETPNSGECYLLEQQGEVSLIKRHVANDYVVVIGIDLKDGTWRSGFYFGAGIIGLENAISYYKEMSL